MAEKTEDSIIRLIRGYDLTASETDHARTYYHYASDEMGSITHVMTGQVRETAADGQGNGSAAGIENPEASVLHHYEYDAWGNPVVCEETVENRFRFNGQQYDPITQQYYLRARYYNPVIARFTQEDTYRGDGLNLYAYCRNNPVYYVDPSGYFANCFKELIKQFVNQFKDDGLSDEDVYGRAHAEAAKQRLATESLSAREQYQLRQRLERIYKGQDTNNILGIPVRLWTNSELQRAVDSIHNAQYGGKWWGNLCPMAVTVGPEGQVIVTRNRGPVRENSLAGQMATQVLGSQVEFPVGQGSNYWRINNDAAYRHAEARGIRGLIRTVAQEDMSAWFADGEARQACSHFSCEPCSFKQQNHNIHNVTGSVLDSNLTNGKISRPYVDNLWHLMEGENRKMRNTLKWSVEYWDKNLKSLEKCFQKDENIIFEYIPTFTERLKTDLENMYISDYSGLSLSYSLCAKNFFVLKKDILNCKKYFYLAAKANEMCCKLFEKGLYSQKDIAKRIKSRNFWNDVYYAFLAGDERLALNLTAEGSFLESLISGNYDEAKEFIEKKKEGEDNLKTYSILWDILVMDEAALTKDLSKRIKEIRKWYSLNFSYIDIWGLGALKLAKRRGISSSIHVAELPEELLEDTPVDHENWKIPREEEMQEILNK